MSENSQSVRGEPLVLLFSRREKHLQVEFGCGDYWWGKGVRTDLRAPAKCMVFCVLPRYARGDGTTSDRKFSIKLGKRHSLLEMAHRTKSLDLESDNLILFFLGLSPPQ